MKKLINTKVMSLVSVATATATSALAATAPAAGTFAYDAYSMAVGDILQGPIGFLVSLGFVAFGFIAIVNKQAGGAAVGLPMLLVGGLIMKLDGITASIGATF